MTALQQLKLFPIHGPTDGTPTIEFARLFITQVHGNSTFTMANGYPDALQEAFRYWSGVLDDSQQEALHKDFSLRGSVSFLVGPPGTGKTHTAIAKIDTAFRCGRNILVTGPSNTSIDELLRKASAARDWRMQICYA